MLVVLAAFMLLMAAGCGGDNLKGDWKAWGKSAYDGSPLIRILHIDKADNGVYLITQEEQYYEHKLPKDWHVQSEKFMHIIGYDEIINHKEAFTWKKRRVFRGSDPYWTGTPLKIAKIYERKGRKYKDVWQANKDNLPLKDGKLLFNNTYYEKTDTAGIDKAMSEWKEKLKKQVGQEIVSDVDLRNKQLKTIIARVTIIENGKKEVFE